MIIIILLSDFFTKFVVILGFKSLKITTVVKSLLLIFMIYFLITNKVWKHKLFKYLLAIFLVFISSQAIMLIRKGVIVIDLLNNAFTLTSYMFMPLVAICFCIISNEEIIQKNINLIKKFALLNAFLIVIGFLGDYTLFKSYFNSSRFGYNGLFISASASSYFYIMIITIYYTEYILNKKRALNIALFLLQVIIAFLLGTKTIWFFILLLGIFHFCIITVKPYRYYFISLLGASITLFFIYKKEVELFIVSLFNFGERYYSEHGFITVITSTRDLFLKKVWSYYIENETITTVFFGGVNVFKHRVEFEFINMFLFFGVLGSILYLILIKTLFKINFNDKMIIKNSLFILIIITSAFAGGFFYSALSSTFFYISFRHINTIILHKNIKN